MNAEVVVQTIQLVVAPAVMVSGCMLIQSSILGRYSDIGTRLRSLIRERVELLRLQDITEGEFIDALFLLDSQLKSLSRRHLLIQKAVLVLYASIFWFLFSMVGLAAAKMSSTIPFALIALTLFLLSIFTLLIGIMLASSEIWISHRAVHSEVRWVITLTKP